MSDENETLRKTVENLTKALADQQAGVKMMTNVLIQIDQRIRALEKAEKRGAGKIRLAQPFIPITNSH